MAAAAIDELTFRRAQRGDERACHDLIARYEAEVFAVLSRLLGPGDLVEELAQEAFLRLLRELGRPALRRPADVSGWLLGLCARLALDELRRPERPETRPAAAPGRAAEAFQRALAGLPPETRAVLVLTEYHDLGPDAVGRALEFDVATVTARLVRGRAAVRAALAEVIDG
jgi:RNA polymerase sigma-70 factor (ECF subfamily)